MQPPAAGLKFFQRLNQPIKYILVAVIVCVFVALVDYFSYDSLNSLPVSTANTGLNGLWLRYFWYHGKYNDQPQEWSAMIKRLRDHQIKYAYFHVLTTQADGTLHIHKLENARKITATVHAQAPGVMPIAWIYVGSTLANGGVDLTKASVRKNLIKETLWLTNECGFDGVQLDYEFCTCGDPGFLQLMEEARAALPKNKLLSVATPMWYPGTLYGWDDAYFSKVAVHADQLAVMCYDSYLYLPRFYVQLVEAQVPHVTTAVAGGNAKCKVLFGLPTYEDVTLSHHRHAESLANSLRGISAGLNDRGTNRSVFDGIALFADYTTDSEEWNIYDRYWLGKIQ